MWNKQRIAEVCRALLRKPWMLLAGALGIALLLAGTLGARCTGESDTETVSSEVGSGPPRVLGAAVNCEGGGSDRIRREVTDLVAALCRLPANRIHVAKMD